MGVYWILAYTSWTHPTRGEDTKSGFDTSYECQYSSPRIYPQQFVCTTLTTVLLGGKAIVIAEFFAFLNIAFGNNPDGALGDQISQLGSQEWLI